MICFGEASTWRRHQAMRPGSWRGWLKERCRWCPPFQPRTNFGDMGTLSVTTRHQHQEVYPPTTLNQSMLGSVKLHNCSNCLCYACFQTWKCIYRMCEILITFSQSQHVFARKKGLQKPKPVTIWFYVNQCSVLYYQPQLVPTPKSPVFGTNP